MSTLELHLVLTTRLDEVLMLRSTHMLKTLNSASSLWASHHIFVVEWAIQALVEGVIHVASCSLWWPSNWSFLASMTWSITSSTSSSLTATLSWLMLMHKVHALNALIKQTVLVISSLWDHWRLWDIWILLVLAPFLHLVEARLLLLVIISTVDWNLIGSSSLLVLHQVRRDVDTPTIVVIMDLVSSRLLLLLVTGVSKLGLVLFVLLDLRGMKIALKTFHIRVINLANLLRAFLRNLDLASSHSVLNDMLSGSCAILHTCDLGLCLASTLSNSLDCGNDLLVVLALSRGRCNAALFFSSLARFGLVDLELEYSVI